MTYKGHDIPLFNRHGARQTRRVYLAKVVTIPPMQEAEVPTYSRAQGRSSRPQMFEPRSTLFFDTKALAPRMLIDPRDDFPRIRLFNPSLEPLTVNIHHCLGEAEDVDDIITPTPIREATKKVKVCSMGLKKANETESENDCSASQECSANDVLSATYDEHAGMVPEHMQQLLENTLQQVEDEEERKAITLLLIGYQDIFAVDETDIGRTDVITHDVDTGNHKPVCQPLRRQSKEEHEAMVAIVNNLRRCGIIQPSKSQWAANIRMAKKKNG